MQFFKEEEEEEEEEGGRGGQEEEDRRRRTKQNRTKENYIRYLLAKVLAVSTMSEVIIEGILNQEEARWENFLKKQQFIISITYNSIL